MVLEARQKPLCYGCLDDVSVLGFPWMYLEIDFQGIQVDFMKPGTMGVGCQLHLWTSNEKLMEYVFVSSGHQLIGNMFLLRPVASVRICNQCFIHSLTQVCDHEEKDSIL